MARSEQAWVDSLLRDETPPQNVLAVLYLYKAKLAVLEAATMASIGYIGTDREESPEAVWWTQRAGMAAGEMAAVGKHLIELPGE